MDQVGLAKPDTGYRKFIPMIAAEDAARLIRKDEQYGASWKRRGGIGAFHVYVRKPDRLETQAGKFGDDIFKAIEAGAADDGESVIDTIRDARGYLTLIEAEAMRLGLIPAPEEVPESANAIVPGIVRPEVAAFARMLEERLRLADRAGPDPEWVLTGQPSPPREQFKTLTRVVSEMQRASQDAFGALSSVVAQSRLHSPSEDVPPADLYRLTATVIARSLDAANYAMTALDLLGVLGG